MAETLLSASHLHYAVAGRTLMADLTLGIEAHSRIGLIGDNGAGKSTLLRLLKGDLPPDRGAVSRRNPCRISMLEQVPTLPAGTIFDALKEPFLPAIEAIDKLQSQKTGPGYDALVHRIEAFGGWNWQHRLERAASALGLTDLDRPCRALSGGYRKRVALARMFLQEPDLIFLDEPTNHLDTTTVEWLERWLGQSTVAAVIVTHDRYFLDQVATKMAELRLGQLRHYTGNYSDYLVARAEEEALDARTEQRTLRVLAHELDWASRSPQARTTKNRARLERLEAGRDAMAQKIRGASVDSLRFGSGPRLGKSILLLEGVTCAHDEAGPLFEPLTWELSAKERWGIIGPNGSGKTTLLTLITGAKQPDTGTITRGKNTEIAYFDQHRTSLDPEALVETVLAPEGGDTVFFAGAPVHIKAWLGRFAFGPHALRMQVKALSGGERNRLALAKLMLTEANLLILDEPTNDLDLLTLNVLEDALLHYPGCVIVVSHDRYFLDKVATHTLALVPPAQAYAQEPTSSAARAPSSIDLGTGGYTDCMARIKQAAQSAAPKASSAPGAKNKAAGSKAKPKLSYKQTQELAGMEAAIEAQELEVARLEAALSDPHVWSGQPTSGPDGTALTQALQQAQAQAKKLYERWQELLDLNS